MRNNKTDPELLNRPLSSFKELGRMAINRLAENHVITVSDLLKLSKKDLKYIPCFGAKSIGQVFDMLRKNHLEMRDQ